MSEALPERLDPRRAGNMHLVASTGGRFVTILNPPRDVLTDEEALRFAAWLVLVAGRGDRSRFDEIYTEICE